MNAIRPILVFLLLTTVLSVQPAASAAVGCKKVRGQQRRGLMMDVLQWLPADTETVMVVQRPFFIEKPLSADEQEEEPLALDEGLESCSTRILFHIRDGRYHKQLRDKKVKLAIMGSRRFRRPYGLGFTRYEGCDILVFEKSLGATGDALLTSFKKDASKLITLEGHEVGLFDTKINDDKWELFMARPRPNVLLCGTDRNYMRQVLSRMAKRRATQTMRKHLNSVDLNAPFWAVRRYERKYAAEDPSCPLGLAVPEGVRDSQAVGWTFSYTPGSGNVATVRYLTKAKDAAHTANQWWQFLNGPQVKDRRPIRTGGVEFTVSPSKGDEVVWFYYALFWLLGHGTVF